MIENLKVRFVRKPQDLDDVLASIHGVCANRIEIQARKELTVVEYEVTAPNRTALYVDPSGSTYGRYVGLRVD